MRWTYDPQADAAYLDLGDGVSIVTVDLRGCDVHLDIDRVLGRVVGIEILGAGAAVSRLEVLLDPPVTLGGDDAASG